GSAGSFSSRRWAAPPSARVAEVRAAVGVEDLPGQELRVVAGEEEGDGRDVGLGIAESLHRALGHQARVLLGVAIAEVHAALRERGGIDDVGGDAGVAPLARGGAGERRDAGLRRAVLAEAGVPALGSERAEVDDAAAAL